MVKPQANSESLVADFEHELNILSALRCLKHPNIIQLLTAFTFGASYNFLLPLADGDLKDVLGSTQRPPGLRSPCEILASLWGLSSALQAVHDYFFEDYSVHQVGCHYDIKPRNILYANGRLLLSDFGLSRLQNEEEGSQTTFKRGEGFYLAPECEASEDNFKPGKIGRASDIWSLACVLTEVMVYMSFRPQDGPAAVKKFYDDRKIKLGGRFICHHFYSDDGVNPAVIKVLKTHMTVSSVDQRLVNLPDLATVIEATLCMETTQRPRAEDLTKYLFHVAQKMIVGQVRSAIEKLSHQMNLGLQIELQRLAVWRNVSGLDANPLEVPGSSWFGTAHSHKDYEALQELLRQCSAEVEFINNELQRDAQPPFRLSHRLQKLQDELWNMQPQAEQRKMWSRLEEQMLQTARTAFHQHTKSLSEYEKYLQLDSSGRVNSVAGSRTYRLACLSTMRDIASTLTEDNFFDRAPCLSRSSLIRLSTYINSNHAKLSLVESQHSIFLLAGTQSKVLVEKLPYGGIWVSHSEELVERVNAVTTLRSRGVTRDIFPILQCRGYYHDVSKFEFGIVYDLPPLAKNTDPITLAQAIKLTASRLAQPSLTQKFVLAKILVSYLLDFHRAGWLHKGISALSVICFPEAFPAIAESLSAVFFIGFSNSRINKPSAFTDPSRVEKEYQHPLYLSNDKPYVGEDGDRSPLRFRQEFDYYSAGLVLLEIAMWKPLMELTHKIPGGPEGVRKEILNTFIPVVKTYMGDKYGEAVCCCLTAYDGQDKSPSEVRNAFYEKVVVPLDRCCV